MLTSSRLPLLIATLLFISACSKQPEQATASGKPFVEQAAADSMQTATDDFHGAFAPGGIAVTYVAKFREGKIQSLVETRNETSQTGAYEFLGARLMKYSGAALASSDTLELVFDEQGKVITASGGDREVSVEEITAIRDRAHSLRSHAVSQYAVKGHDKG